MSIYPASKNEIPDDIMQLDDGSFILLFQNGDVVFEDAGGDGRVVFKVPGGGVCFLSLSVGIGLVCGRYDSVFIMRDWIRSSSRGAWLCSMCLQ